MRFYNFFCDTTPNVMLLMAGKTRTNYTGTKKVGIIHKITELKSSRVKSIYQKCLRLNFRVGRVENTV